MENSTNNTIFVSGMFLNKVSDSAPAYIITNQSIHMETLYKWLQANKGLADDKGYIRIVGKEGQSGKRYFAVDTWKPKAELTTSGGVLTDSSVPPLEGKGIDMAEFTGEADESSIPF